MTVALDHAVLVTARAYVSGLSRLGVRFGTTEDGRVAWTSPPGLLGVEDTKAIRTFEGAIARVIAATHGAAIRAA